MCCTHRMMMGGSSGSRLSLFLSYKLLRTAQKRKKKTNVRSFVPLHSHHRVYYAERGPWRAQEREEEKKYDNL